MRLGITAAIIQIKIGVESFSAKNTKCVTHVEKLTNKLSPQAINANIFQAKTRPFYDIESGSKTKRGSGCGVVAPLIY
ncbi:hypothetical protein AVO44_10385 [Ruegeria profundi]|uniref:Uncharacterized protein n=1 Tax=Ruegeria profundi TaxID=1685378 RepID=A0A0X3TW58_9RHOB|nr:hypothetical protein AVO44_10385 [Ruegeria profundi]